MQACRGVDVLIHEAIDPEALRKTVPSQALYEAIVAHHTTTEQAADIFRRVAPRLAVFSHVVPPNADLGRVRRTYSGRVETGEDLMAIDIGSEIVVRRPAPAAR